jgi:hypothetical protein
LKDVDHAAQVDHCLQRKLIGIGWRMDELGPDASLQEACDRIESTEEPGWGHNAARTVFRFGAEAEIDDFVWTRDTHGRYWLCQIKSAYRYDGSDAAREVDVHQVRDARWPRARSTILRCLAVSSGALSVRG